MKKKLTIELLALALLLPVTASGWHKLLSPNFKSLQVVVNNDFEALPVMTLGSDDVMRISFDELSHNYHRLVYRIEACNPDWSSNEELFESDWLEGFNGMPIDDYQNSLNTTVLYTHYELQLPNGDTRLKMSGNYRLHICDEDDSGREVAIVEFRVVEQVVGLQISVTTNTDIDLNQSHQQVQLNMRYNGLRVTYPEEQIQTVIMQNGREDNMKVNVKPNYISAQGLTWEHNRSLIFEAGNEYHKYEVLDTSHPTMGLESMTWDEGQRRFHATPFLVEQRRNYVYDVDANGAFLVRNSDNVEVDYTSDYVWVHYRLKPLRRYDHAHIMVDGRWACGDRQEYFLQWNEDSKMYEGVVMQKLGYYNYQLLLSDLDGTTHQLPEEGSFYQTENRYQALVYYRGNGERAWRIVGYREVTYK